MISIPEWLIPWRRRPPPTDVSSNFRTRYERFQQLLESNSQLSKIIGDMEEKLQGRQIYGMSYVRLQAERAIFHTRRMVECLDAISRQPHPQLFEALERIEAQIGRELSAQQVSPVTELILPLEQVNRDLVDWVGGKSANLGEVRNRVKLLVPDGFAVTTRAFEHFISSNGLLEMILEKIDQDLQEPDALQRVSDELQALIIAAPVPQDIADAMYAAYDRMVARIRDADPGFEGSVSMRSSAVGEDTELSFAGQHLSLLNVRRDDLLDAWRRVVASLFNPWALSYRLQKGVLDASLTMGVACLQMIDAVASGVAYSRHPFNELEDVVTLNAVWGLGPAAVDGRFTPDAYTVGREEPFALLESRIAVKPVRLVRSASGGLLELCVPEDEQRRPCLTPEQTLQIARCAVALETHYGTPQDIEWAIDAQGRLFILQSRPIRRDAAAAREATPVSPRPGRYHRLLEGGKPAFPGVAAGPVFQVHSDEDLQRFPDGAVLVARHPSPRFVVAMAKARAIVTDSGSIVGHMASLCREFEVPTLVDARVATVLLKQGQEVTVDAYTGWVYEGRVEELLALRADRAKPAAETPVTRALARVADLIVPLRLINPRSPDFSPRSCRSLHDIMRFVHESSYAAMFRISDLLTEREGGAVKLAAPIPLDLHLIDLGGGLEPGRSTRRSVTVEEVASIPFKALLKGMLNPALKVHRPRPVELGGFLSVMTEQMLTPPRSGGERFGDRSYAIISDRYLHFSSRIGYHYSILDSYCGEANRKSYITFYFQGGAADETRRGRRARAIAAVLKALDFSVDTRADRVDARLKRVELPVMLERLDLIGRLLQFTRQVDMLMHSEDSVSMVAKAFLEGRYDLEKELG